MIIRHPAYLIYDIETSPLAAYIWRPGKQVVRHGQLLYKKDYTDIITIQYSWAHEDKVYNLNTVEDMSTAEAVALFDAEVRKADIVVGKNSNRFDSGHVNTIRVIKGLPPVDNWGTSKSRQDVELWISGNFNFPSKSLDYVAGLLLGSGKDKMEMSDWVKISNYKDTLKYMEQIAKEFTNTSIIDMAEAYTVFQFGKSFDVITKEGSQALKKMIKYGNKDTIDTKRIMERIAPYSKSLPNVGRFLGNQDGQFLRCKHCGSNDLRKNGIDYRYASPKQKFLCNGCKREAGKGTINKSGNCNKID